MAPRIGCKKKNKVLLYKCKHKYTKQGERLSIPNASFIYIATSLSKTDASKTIKMIITTGSKFNNGSNVPNMYCHGLAKMKAVCNSSKGKCHEIKT